MISRAAVRCKRPPHRQRASLRRRTMSGDESTSVDGEDEATVQDLPVPTYDRAPATIQEQVSPFRGIAAPRITSRSPTSPMGTGPMGTGLVPPRIVGAPQLAGGSGSLGLPPDGPTVPDGIAIPPGSWDNPTDPDAAPADMQSWEGATDPGGPPPRMRPPDPDPNEAKVQVSLSMEMDAIRVDRQNLAAAPVVPAARRARAQQPTQLLPALDRKKREDAKEGSDLPMILGLLALGLFILALIGGGVFFAVRVMGAPEPEQAPPQTAVEVAPAPTLPPFPAE